MRDIKDYIHTRTVVVCKNKEEWDGIKKLCKDYLEFDHEFADGVEFFALDVVGSVSYHVSEKQYKVLTYSDFVPCIPKLEGVSMQCSDDGISFTVDKVYGFLEESEEFLGYSKTWKYVKPIQIKVLSTTLEDLAQKFSVDEVVIKYKSQK